MKQPSSYESEKAILSSMLIDGNIIPEVLGALKVEDFYGYANKTIYRTIKEMFNSQKVIDFALLVNELETKNLLKDCGGIDYVTDLMVTVPTAVNYKEYIKVVRDKAISRELIKISSSLINNATNGDNSKSLLDYAETNLFNLEKSEEYSSLRKLNGASALLYFDAIKNNPEKLQGLSTGLFELDKFTKGLQKGQLIYLAARPGVGKTSLAMNIVNYVAMHKKTVAVFSLEMPEEQLAQRSLCSIAGISMEKASSGNLSILEWSDLFEAQKKINSFNIHIDDSSLNTPADILSKCRRLYMQQKSLDLIMIDYLQLMTSGNSKLAGNRQQEITEISRNLKILAKELNVPVIVLSQLSRAVETRKDADGGHRPMLSDLRESGSIEQDADMVWFIYRASTYAPTDERPEREIAELIIAKNRMGRCGTVKLGWDGTTTSFRNLEKGADTESLIATEPITVEKNRIVEEAEPTETMYELPDNVNKEVDEIFS